MPQRPDHWHVIGGSPGFPPSIDRTYPTKATALAALREEQAAYREVGMRFTRPSQTDPSYRSAPGWGLVLYVEPCWAGACVAKEED